jgi:hypothetical protein
MFSPLRSVDLNEKEMEELICLRKEVLQLKGLVKSIKLIF